MMVKPWQETAAHIRTQFDLALTEYCQHRHGQEDPLSRACRYALEGTGKRVRPILCQMAAQAIAPNHEQPLLRAALSIELMHTYSLVHDDLPCMDDDDLRRGRPTTHIVHGEALAVLTGDALLTDAFSILVVPDSVPQHLFSEPPSPQRLSVLVAELAQAAGSGGMVLGQALDLHWTGRAHEAASNIVETIHTLKTGQLLGAAAAMGAASVTDDLAMVQSMRTFGRALGLAFQIRDDLLDDMAGTGKSAGKDRAAAKMTFLARMDHKAAETEAERVTHQALAALKPFGEQAAPLADFAQALLTRKH